MAFNPAVLHPPVDPAFEREVKAVDPSLRVVWGYDRYFVNKWVIERRIPDERYQAMYRQALKEDWPRFIDRPIYDTNQRVYDAEGNETGYQQIGIDRFDVRPEWEHLLQGEADGRLLLELKRAYAWNVRHPFSRQRFEEQQRIEDAQREAQEKRRRVDLEMEAVEEAWHEHGKRRSYVLDATLP